MTKTKTTTKLKTTKLKTTKRKTTKRKPDNGKSAKPAEKIETDAAPTKPKAKPAKATSRKPEPVEQQLYCELSGEEHRERAEDLARTVRERNAITDRKKAAASEFKAQSDEKIARIDRLAEVVRSGKELRAVDCEWHFDFKRNEKKLVRLDTRKTVRKMTLTKQELQVELDV